MKKNILYLGILTLVTSCHQGGSSTNPIRIGWQTAWAGQGQVMQVLAKTDIATKNAAQIDLRDFLFGPDLNEAAFSGNLDVTNAGIVPVINLLAASDDWSIVARQVDFEIAIVGRIDSKVKRMTDLKGKHFGIPIGGGSHPFALEQLRDAGLTVGQGSQEVDVINVKPSEMPLAIRQGNVDAVASWEPTTTLSRDAGGEVIARTQYAGFICANKQLITKRPKDLHHLLKAYADAFLYVARNRSTADRWFAEKSGISSELLHRITDVEPNFRATSIRQITIVPTEARLAQAQRVADMMWQTHLIKRKVDIHTRSDLRQARLVEKDLQ
jgi:ABC-type nitrate/sulfonate/bicarbonate transport system substrate-binding protein